MCMGIMSTIKDINENSQRKRPCLNGEEKRLSKEMSLGTASDRNMEN